MYDLRQDQKFEGGTKIQERLIHTTRRLMKYQDLTVNVFWISNTTSKCQNKFNSDVSKNEVKQNIKKKEIKFQRASHLKRFHSLKS